MTPFARHRLARIVTADPAAVVLVTLPVLAVAVSAALGLPPIAFAAGLAAAIAAAGWRRAVRALGVEGLWLGLLAGVVLAGELSAVSLGGQNGRILWADAWVGAGLLVLLLRGRLALAVPRAPFLAALVPFLAWCAVGLPFARDPLTAIAEYKEWLVAAMAGLCAVRWATDRRRARLLLASVALAGAALAALMALVAWRSPLGFEYAVLTKTVDLPWGRSNYLAGLLAISFPVGLGLLGAASHARERLGWLAVVLATAFGLAISASKGAMLAVALAVGICLLGPLAAGTSRALRLTILAVFGLVMTLFVAGPLRVAMDYRLQGGALDYSSGERFALYRLALDLGLQHPLLGVGLNNFSVAARSLHGVDTVPHNFELGFFAELGGIGLVMALVWGGVLLGSAWRAVRASRAARERTLALGAAAAVLGAALHNQVESTLYGEQFKLFLFLVAAAIWRLGLPERASCNPARSPDPPIACATHGSPPEVSVPD
jgi:O-antigen ligase